MLANDVMTTRVATVPASMPVTEVARFLLERRISGAPVVDDDDNTMIGIVSEGDLLRRPEAGTAPQRSWWLNLLASPEEVASEYVRTHGRRAADVMTRDIVTVEGSTPLDEVAALLERHRIKRVPVVEGGRLVGIVSRADILRAFAAHSGAESAAPSTDDRTLRERLLEHLHEVGLPHAHMVNAVVSDGIVRLWGITESEAEAEALRVAAEQVAGVRRVESELVVRPHFGAFD